MHEVTTKQLRSRLGGYLKQVKEGLTLIVTRQGQPVAELRPYGADAEHNGHPAPPRPPASMNALGLTSYQPASNQPEPEASQPEEPFPLPDQEGQNGLSGTDS